MRSKCFENYIKKASYNQCDCAADCEETDYSVLQSNQPFHLPQNFCTSNKLKVEYPYYVYCGLCQNIIHFHKIRLIYDYYVSNGTNPDNIDEFCHGFISKHVALVKIEMMSRSVVRSIRDKRFSLTSQVSALGKGPFGFMKCLTKLSVH